MVSRHLSEWCGQGMVETSAASKFQRGSQDSGSWEAVAPNPIPRQAGQGGGSGWGLLKLSWVWCSLGFCQLPYMDTGAFPFPIAWPSCQVVGLRSLGLSSSALQVRPCMTWSQPPLLASLAATLLNRCAHPFHFRLKLPFYAPFLMCPSHCLPGNPYLFFKNLRSLASYRKLLPGLPPMAG